MDAADGDHPVENDHAATSPAPRLASYILTERNLLEERLGQAAIRGVELRRVKVRQAHLNPGVWIARIANTQPVAVTDIADRSRKPLPRLRGQATFAGVRPGGCRHHREGKGAEDERWWAQHTARRNYAGSSGAGIVRP